MIQGRRFGENRSLRVRKCFSIDVSMLKEVGIFSTLVSFPPLG